MTTNPIYLPTHVDVYQSLIERDGETYLKVTTSLGEEAQLLGVIYPERFLQFSVDYQSKPMIKGNVSCNCSIAPILFDYLTQTYFGNLMLYVENMGLTGDFPFMFMISNYNIERMTPYGFYKGSLTLEPWAGFYLEQEDVENTEHFTHESIYEEGSQLKSILLPSFQTMTIHPLE